jgi:membrane protein YqaA with SNARE-associated domain
MKRIFQAIKKFCIEHKQILIFMAITFIISTTFFILRPWLLEQIKQSPWMSNIYYSINDQIQHKSMIWLFIATFIGSIFMFSMPVELVFVYYIITGANVFLSLIAATAGTISARCVNFLIGSKFRHLTAHLKEKGENFNRKFHKATTSFIFFGNFIPAFPVEHFAVFVGTTHYRFKKFLIYEIAGKFLKLLIIAIFLKFFLMNMDLLNANFYDLTKDLMAWILNLLI